MEMGAEKKNNRSCRLDCRYTHCAQHFPRGKVYGAGIAMMAHVITVYMRDQRAMAGC